MTEEEIAELKENSKGFPKGKMHGKCPMGKGFKKDGFPKGGHRGFKPTDE